MQNLKNTLDSYLKNLIILKQLLVKFYYNRINQRRLDRRLTYTHIAFESIKEEPTTAVGRQNSF